MSSLLPVEGAALRYLTLGTGPFLLLIPGISGTLTQWLPSLPMLASSFTVCAYDRRGYGQSHLDGTEPQPFGDRSRVQRDADDAAALIRHLCAPAYESLLPPAYEDVSQAAFVLGTGTGAVVAVQLLEQHPELIRTILAHDPPLWTAVLPGSVKYAAKLQSQQAATQTHRKFRGLGSSAAAAWLSSSWPSVDQLWLSDEVARNPLDALLWFEHELVGYAQKEVDAERLAGVAGRKLVVAVSRKAGKVLDVVADALAGRFGVTVLRDFTDGQLGFVSQGQLFASRVKQCLKSTSTSR